MGIEKQGSKGRNSGGGLLHLFGWSAKSRKKLFSSKTDIPEKSKQKKKIEGNLPTTRLRMIDEYGIEAGSRSMRECNDYSCASSLTEDSFYTSKPPNLVARLMGLDYLPTPNFLEPNSIPVSDCQPFRRTHYKSKSLECFQDFTESKYHKVAENPIEEFKTEVLPPESAKPVTITRHKLLPTVKNLNIIDPCEKINLPLSSSSSSVPLRIRELKENVRAVKKPSKSDCTPVKNLRGGHSKTKSLNGSEDNEEASNGVKSKGKSISLALQAKVNVQKREALNSNSKKEKNESMLSSQRVAAQSSTTPERPFLKKGTNVLRQNNLRQNFIVDRKKPDSHVGKKPLNGDDSFSRQRNRSKPVKPSRVTSGKLASEVKDERVARKKRSLDGSDLLKKGKNEKNVDSSGATEVVSFTFNAPMTRPGSVGPGGTEKNFKIFSTDSQSNWKVLNSDGVSRPKSSSLGHNVKGGETLCTFLEQKLIEATHKIEYSQRTTKNGNYANHLEGQPGYSCYSVNRNPGFMTGQMWQGPREDTGMSRFPSPVSVLEQFSIAESCSSLDTADSNSTGGVKSCSSIQFHDTYNPYSTNACLPLEGYADLSDTASSTPAKTVSRSWELDYVKELLNNIEPMFKDYALGKTKDFIKPRLFRQLENRKGHPNNVCEINSRINRRLMFDCVNECLDLRCRQYAFAGYELWAKGLRTVKRKETLADDVHKEISGWGAMGHFMVDEIVDSDMTGKNRRWLDYEVELFEVGMKIESRVLSALLDEVVDDILVF